jgi:hypothetical protein
MSIAIELDILNSRNNGKVNCLPHRVTTLSIAIRNPDVDIPHRLLIKPTRISDPPYYVA